MQNTYAHLFTCVVYGLCLSVPAATTEARESSSTLYGPLGLNVVPNARMDDVGTIRLGVSHLDPYTHGWASFQIAKPLSIIFRQTGEVSRINEDPVRLYPGLDLKLRLAEEQKVMPDISIGVQSAVGHKRMAGEYLALTKRYHDFDFTGGIGWGRYGSAAHIKNPLRIFGNHFDGARRLNDEESNEPENWFTGEDAGFFAGLEYFTPITGLSLKADYGADHFVSEQATFDYDRPAPWSVGFNYAPPVLSGIGANVGVALQGNDKVMARLSIDGNVKNWPGTHKTIERIQSPFRAYRTDKASPTDMRLQAGQANVGISTVEIDDHEATTFLALKGMNSDLYSAPLQIGHLAKHISNHGGSDVERISITPVRYGLHGPKISVLRSDLENAAHHNGSAEEIWHTAEITRTAVSPPERIPQSSASFLGFRDISIKWDSEFSIAEQDIGGLYRTGFVIGAQAPKFVSALNNFFSFRVNVADNLDELDKIRFPAILPVRSDIDEFTERTIGLDTAFTSFTHSLRSDLHMSIVGGYLEEQYAGGGGEVLFRPHNARWAIGGEGFLALKRDPDSALNYKLTGDRLLSGHVKAWYDIPSWDATLKGKFGRYLAEDIGGTLGLEKKFRSGASLEAYATITDKSDFDLFGLGGTTSADHGIRFSLPLGGLKPLPDGLSADVTFSPLGREIGQSVKNPLPLYELTDPFSTRHMAEYWSDIKN